MLREWRRKLPLQDTTGHTRLIGKLSIIIMIFFLLSFVELLYFYFCVSIKNALKESFAYIY